MRTFQCWLCDRWFHTGHRRARHFRFAHRRDGAGPIIARGHWNQSKEEKV